MPLTSSVSTVARIICKTKVDLSKSNNAIKALSRESSDDALIIEEPMEIVIEQHLPTGTKTTSIYTTMRTPGNDFFLAKGFLFTEGVIHQDSDIVSIKHCGPAMPPFQLQNIIKITLQPTLNWQTNRAERHIKGNSSCGLCGVTSLQAVKMDIPIIQSKLRVKAQQLLELGQDLHKSQSLFEQTGAVHAVSLFDDTGTCIKTMEDVGRHNAMDKLIGYALEEELLPLNNNFMITTSRASFELVQKSARAGCALLAAISAPSSLAVQLAEEINQTLIGFLRPKTFNLYTDLDHRILND